MFNSSLDLGQEGQVAVITGAGRGVGRALTSTFVTAGTKVVAVDIDSRELDETVSQIPNRGVHLSLVRDLSRVNACEEVVRATDDTYSRLDILVNNAPFFSGSLWMRLTKPCGSIPTMLT